MNRNSSNPCFLYKMFNSNNEALYIGIANDSDRRIYGHKTSAKWFSFVSRIDVLKYENRSDAAMDEKILIRRLRPVYNVHHNKKPSKAKLFFSMGATYTQKYIECRSLICEGQLKNLPENLHSCEMIIKKDACGIVPPDELDDIYYFYLKTAANGE